MQENALPWFIKLVPAVVGAILALVLSGDIDKEGKIQVSLGVIGKFLFSVSVSLYGRYRDWETDRKSTRLNSSHITRSRMPSSA